ncbi:MAG: hypothetical protein AABW90_03105 [Nanoarchaeota archaeon]
MKHITTIKIHQETKERLDRLKEYERETYEEILRKILFILNISKKNAERAQRILNRIDSATKRKLKQSKQYKKDTEVYQEDRKD